MPTNKQYNLVVENMQSTVVASYEPDKSKREEFYQSEAELEKAFINQLKDQAYEHLPIASEEELISNLRKQLEKLNNYTFTDNEWKHFFESEIANPSQGIVEKTFTIQEDYKKSLARDNKQAKNIYLIKKDNIHDNRLQVISQYKANQGRRLNRYDVTILINGLPLVHIELKRRGVALQEAFNQINRYQQESFWASSSLFEYIQLFVISNGTNTKYYSNTTRFQHIKDKTGKSKKGKRTSSSFEFTNFWADAKNKPITDLVDFTKTFFAKHTILNILTKYCVFTEEKELLAMRPYQIVATERILNKIEVSTNYKKFGTIEAGGYIWHTTGSGKTLTSFKTAQLASKLPYIDKVLFVVDRKDLDYQTMIEYDKFEKGAASSTRNTAVLKKQLENSDTRIIVTTIQKLDRFIKKNKAHPIFKSKAVIIFDECHRSQFGEMHKAIVKSFKNYYLFGFTGTPIFTNNASGGGSLKLKTTEQVFGKRLHTYTIVNAISDKNVLPFRVEYYSTFREAEDIEDEEVRDIDREGVFINPRRIENNVRHIRKHFDQKTKRNSFYQLKERRLAGFNSIFAVSSIKSAKRYYSEFKKQLADVPSDQQLKVALIFSFSVNEDDGDGIVDENLESTAGLDVNDRDFLENAIQDYNKMFETSFDTSSDGFQGYYKDLSQRVRDREVDLLIVVNMFLTGFDAKTLNTLWVDKNLRSHSLLQAFSRTNRILNSIKTFGNIITFRNLERATNDAVALYGNKDARGIILIRPYNDYYYGYKDQEKEIRGYKDFVKELLEQFPIGEPIIGEKNKKRFINLYNTILKLHNILSTFDEFIGNEILSERDIQDYHSMYIDLYREFRQDSIIEKEDINDDLIFEMELIKQIEINIDYILSLIKKYHDDHIKNREILLDINRAIDSSVELRNKKELINSFVETLKPEFDVDEQWNEFIKEKKKEELEKIIKEEKLDQLATYKFITDAFKDGAIPTIGTSLGNIMIERPTLFSPDDAYRKKRETVLAKLINFFEKFFNISNNKIKK